MYVDKPCDQLSKIPLMSEGKYISTNMFTILILLLTLPVGTCSWERSFSSLRRLCTGMRVAENKYCFAMTSFQYSDDAG